MRWGGGGVVKKNTDILPRVMRLSDGNGCMFLDISKIWTAHLETVNFMHVTSVLVLLRQKRMELLESSKY